ncbi:molybdenum cofactor biosynthesis protein MoaE [Paenibacillus sp. GbtcB18]|uniref:molybdenum cofactor biosynthesis protein n=1 Tax=Paenibacillus sp. GbtcB18 TaxID=2824763 RepID=UPI001C2F5DD9|nr:molybdenum cofactor biosynthesis protein MoaE [Paenibacillus sp. GbtcB18]
MTFHIRLFAGLADELGRPSIDIALSPDASGHSATVQDLLNEIAERFPAARSLLAHCFLAKNHAYAAPHELVCETDELALIPPVSGGSGEAPDAGDEAAEPVRYVLTREPIEPAEVLHKVTHPDCGATLAFIGTTREHTHGVRTVLLEYEAYEPMAVSVMETIGAELEARWPGCRCAMTHRLGPVGIGESSLVIAVSTPHRADCYEASRYAIERVKQILPVWKKEIGEDGSEWKGYVSPEGAAGWNPLAPPPGRE